MQAFTKKPMKPSFTPWRFSKPSLYWLRSAITSLMSTSLKVVSMAAACLRLLEPPGDGLAQAGHPHPLFAVGARGRARPGARARAGAGLERGQRVALGDPAVPAGTGDGRRLKLVLGDDPLHRWRQRQLARRLGGRGAGRRLRRGRARLGFRRRRPERAGAGWGGREAAGRRPAEPAAMPDQSARRTVTPSSASISLRMPSSGATTSRLTLSVSSSTSSSSRLTASPAFLAQRARSPR